MTVQKKQKKKRIKKPRNPNVFKWTPQRKKAALLLSLGTKNYEEVAAEVRVHNSTLWEWRKNPIFLKEVDRLTLENELTTRAGLLRECLKGLDLKRGHIEGDKNTHLHYVQAIADLQGISKQKVELSGKMGMEHSGGVVVYIPDNGRDPDLGSEKNED